MAESEIPEDIKRVAMAYVGQPVEGGDLTARDVIATNIARAILAERERCALTAEHLNGWGRDKGAGGHALHIAKVIRQQ